ncbi:hypothetical protein DRQ11_00240 [candidate division KSB1 bacterium]|nr:hypothetical protein [Candidatus Neomarinimicrobiota bacterium]RKY89774.1 MAG: hypothetical protein DRQ11_00240 [candidate division KSB1 bacterium]
MALPPLIIFPTEAEYRTYFINKYVGQANSVITFDGITVRFFRENFNHAFFTSSSRKFPRKDQFDRSRAERIDWIKHVLEDPAMEVYRRVMPNGKVRRIVLEPTTPYAVIIQIDPKDCTQARFITAYIVNSSSAVKKMRSNPKW